MTQVGEGVAVTTIKETKPGSLRVQVRDSIDNKLISGAEVSIGSKSLTTDDSGEAVFDDIPSGATGVEVRKHFKEADYIKFVTHYPKIVKNYEARSISLDSAIVSSGNTSKLRVYLQLYSVVNEVIFYRRNIDVGGEDKYGHWWTVCGPNHGFGWWPKYPIGHPNNKLMESPTKPKDSSSSSNWREEIGHKFDVARYKVLNSLYQITDNNLSRTFNGVEGELNGVTSFNGIAKNGIFRDPHQIQGDDGDESYSPVTLESVEMDFYMSGSKKFATVYSGDWSWRFEKGNHCHTFQKGLIKILSIDKFKVIK